MQDFNVSIKISLFFHSSHNKKKNRRFASPIKCNTMNKERWFERVQD